MLIKTELYLIIDLSQSATPVTSVTVSPGCDSDIQGEVPAPAAQRQAGGGPGQRQVAV